MRSYDKDRKLYAWRIFVDHDGKFVIDTTMAGWMCADGPEKFDTLAAAQDKCEQYEKEAQEYIPIPSDAQILDYLLDNFEIGATTECGGKVWVNTEYWATGPSPKEAVIALMRDPRYQKPRRTDMNDLAARVEAAGWKYEGDGTELQQMAQQAALNAKRAGKNLREDEKDVTVELPAEVSK
jgi:hypothetical protein